MNRMLITGASGFVGSALCRRALFDGHRVRGAVLPAELSLVPDGVELCPIESIGHRTPWKDALEDVDTIVHLAARVHIMNDEHPDPMEAFREVNTRGTRRLAEEAARMGVRRLVFISTIKVNGEETFERPFDVTDAPNPQDPYGLSKWEAELSLYEIAERTGLEVVVIRPPLCYGPGVKANFYKLMELVSKEVPLPLASIENRRSLVALDNLVDLLLSAATHPAAAGELFLAGDGEDLSTPEMVRRLAHALGKDARLVPFPPGLMRMGTELIGKGGVYQRLGGSLQVDISRARRVMGWKPPVTVDEAFAHTARWYRKLPR
jgi:nucleoside-diphosphate-sugar epimerase